MSPHSRVESGVAFESMFEHASVGIIISNADGKIELVNAHASRLFGYEPGELVGQKIEVLIPMPLRHRHVDHRAKYTQQMTPRPMGIGMDLSALKKDGSTFPVEVSLASYDTPEGREVVSFINDISKRKKNEEDLKTLTEELEQKVTERTDALSQAIKELQQTNEDLSYEMEYRKKAEEEVRQAFEKERVLGELKSRFVSMASHEFRTPLSGILTSASLIERYNADSNRDKIAKHVLTIKSSVHSLTNILNDFLSLDKLDAGKIERHSSEFALSDFASELAQEMEAHAKKGQKIVHAHQGQGNLVMQDREMLRNILINLLSNALKYSPENAPVHFTTSVDKNSIILSIADSGIGIPEAEQAHLFERFFRASNAMLVQGTGLGLNIVRRYLDLLKGTIQCKSRENEGTTFTVTLPKEL